MQNRNRRFECDVCNKPMRSDTLKRHKKIHKDLLSHPDNGIKDELKSRQEFKKKQEEKIQKVVEIARDNDLPIPEEITESVKLVRKSMTFTKPTTLEKIELGKQVTTIVESGKVMYEALGKIDKEAFDTYRNSNSI